MEPPYSEVVRTLGARSNGSDGGDKRQSGSKGRSTMQYIDDEKSSSVALSSARLDLDMANAIKVLTGEVKSLRTEMGLMAERQERVHDMLAQIMQTLANPDISFVRQSYHTPAEVASQQRADNLTKYVAAELSRPLQADHGASGVSVQGSPSVVRMPASPSVAYTSSGPIGKPPPKHKYPSRFELLALFLTSIFDNVKSRMEGMHRTMFTTKQPHAFHKLARVISAISDVMQLNLADPKNAGYAQITELFATKDRGIAARVSMSAYAAFVRAPINEEVVRGISATIRALKHMPEVAMPPGDYIISWMGETILNPQGTDFGIMHGMDRIPQHVMKQLSTDQTAFDGVHEKAVKYYVMARILGHGAEHSADIAAEVHRAVSVGTTRAIDDLSAMRSYLNMDQV